MVGGLQLAGLWEARGGRDWWLSRPTFMVSEEDRGKTEDCQAPCSWSFTDTFFKHLSGQRSRPIAMGSQQNNLSISVRATKMTVSMWVCTKPWEETYILIHRVFFFIFAWGNSIPIEGRTLSSVKIVGLCDRALPYPSPQSLPSQTFEYSLLALVSLALAFSTSSHGNIAKIFT